jgi:hypothetical protein
MAIKTNNKDINTIYCPAVNGTRSEAQAVRIHNGTAWTEVWTNIKIMTLLSNSITEGASSLSADKRTLQLYKFMNGPSDGTQSGGGTIIAYLDGLWTNPVVSFGYEGGFTYRTAPDVSTTPNMVSAGSISLYRRKQGETNASTINAVNNVGTINASDFDNDNYTTTLTGTYDRIGLSIYMNSFSGTYYDSLMLLTVKNFNIGTQKVGFPDALIYDYQD